jgi:hypothetical protein
VTTSPVHSVIVDGLYTVRDRILLAITRLQSDDHDGAAAELEAATETVRNIIEELRT